MKDICRLLWCTLVGLFRSRASLQAEILLLRHQLNVLRRKSPKRMAFTGIDRLIFAGLYRLAPGALRALKVVKPETVIRWHRTGFRAYWRWKSRPRAGRPQTPLEMRRLIRDVSLANPLWARHGSMANCSSSASISDKLQSPSIWLREGVRHRRDGERLSAIMPRASPRSICLWCRRYHSGFYLGY